MPGTGHSLRVSAAVVLGAHRQPVTGNTDFPGFSQQRCNAVLRFQAMRQSTSLFVLVAAIGLWGCGGSSASVPGHYQYPCTTGTSQTLANPVSGQGRVAPTLGNVTVVAFGNSNTLYNNYNQWIVTLIDDTGQPWTGGALSLVADPSGPHPYPSDFYYASSFPMLNSGHTYRAYLSQPSASCTPLYLGQFST